MQGKIVIQYLSWPNLCQKNSFIYGICQVPIKFTNVDSKFCACSFYFRVSNNKSS